MSEMTAPRPVFDRRTLLRGVAGTALASIVAATTRVSAVTAAPDFADPAFAAQWNTGEAIVPNFWGPAISSGVMEEYKEAQGGKRLVQYFEKGRMELTNGTVTNGLLATELCNARIQVGQDAVEAFALPSLRIAGDPVDANPCASYGSFTPPTGPAKALRDQAPNHTGVLADLQYTLSADRKTGTVTGDESTPSSGALALSAYDSATQHNVPTAFADFRARVGLPSVGLAITEPFHSTVLVGGKQIDLLIQIFERRVLTYQCIESRPIQSRVRQHRLALSPVPLSEWRSHSDADRRGGTDRAFSHR